MTPLLRRLLLALLGVWLLTGFYTIRGNEKGAVRRFGQLKLPLRGSGLHYDWPSPFTRVDRVNLAEARGITIGATAGPDGTSVTGLTQPSPRALLTGDQNLLHVRGQVLYRPSEEHIGDYLFAQASAEDRLTLLADALLSELIARSGVDFAHGRGIGELNAQFTARLRVTVAEQRLGIEIEQAVIEQVEPPLRVKAEFLDVSNARAEQARNVQESRTWGEQKLAQAKSEAQRLQAGAQADRLARLASAQGSADRFGELVTRMHAEAERLDQDYAAVRTLTAQRMSWQMLRELWPKIRKKTILHASGPVDLSILPP